MVIQKLCSISKPFFRQLILLHSGCTFGPTPLCLGLHFSFSLKYWIFSLNQHSPGCLVLITVFYRVFFRIAWKGCHHSINCKIILFCFLSMNSSLYIYTWQHILSLECGVCADWVWFFSSLGIKEPVKHTVMLCIFTNCYNATFSQTVSDSNMLSKLYVPILHV